MRSISPVIHLESSEAPARPACRIESAEAAADDHHARLIIQSRAASFCERRRQFLLVRIDHEHGQQLRGFGLARVLTNGVSITRHLGEALPAR